MAQQVKDFADLPAAITVWPGLGEAFGLSRASCYSLVKQPGFPAVRVGRRKIIVPKNRLIEWLEKQQI